MRADPTLYSLTLPFAVSFLFLLTRKILIDCCVVKFKKIRSIQRMDSILSRIHMIIKNYSVKDMLM